MKITKEHLKSLISEEYKKYMDEAYMHKDSYALNRWTDRVFEYIKQRVNVEEVDDAEVIRKEMIDAINRIMKQVTDGSGKVNIKGI